MKSANITITFNGQTEEAFNLYKSVFGGEFIMMQRMKDIPNAPEMPEAEANKILFMSLPMGNSVLMGMDIPAHMPQSTEGTNFMVTVETESEEETTQFFNGLAADGMVMMPLGDQFWGAFFGMVKDKFGIQWMLSFTK